MRDGGEIFLVFSLDDELIILLLVFILIAVLAYVTFEHKHKNKDATILLITLALAGLIEAYLLIHLFFCYQLGFPASVLQDDMKDLSLTASDWLSFLSGYLGFAGSLIMAVLVYRQSKKIDALTISEYSTSLRFKIDDCLLSKDSLFDCSNIFQSLPGNSKLVYTFHCSRDEKCNNSNGILLFVNITNDSKVPMNALSFTAVEICEIKKGEKYENYKYEIRKGEWDPADKKIFLLPHESILRCFLIESLPNNIEPSWLKFKYHYESNTGLSSELIIYMDDNGKILQLDS